MRLNTFILTLCVCVLHVRAASIAAEKRVGALDDVDLDSVAEHEQVTVKDVDNNLRKTADIPVKVIEEAVVDENSNDYIPKDDDNVIVKRIEVDLSNPGLPQRQEHETQNPGNYGEKEKALYNIKKRIEETEKIFKDGLQEVSESFKTLFRQDEDLPAIQLNIKNLKGSFSNQFEKLDEDIKTFLKPALTQTKTTSDENLAIVENRLENLRKSFNNGVDVLTEGVDLLTIIREEDEAAKSKSLLNEELAKEDTATDVKPQQPAAVTQAPVATTVSTNPIFQYISTLNNGVLNAMSNLNSAVQNFFTGGQQNAQAQNTGNQNSQVPAGAQSDTVPSAPTPAPAPWGPQAFLQGVQTSLQNSWQNLFNSGQNQQSNQQPTVQQPINSGGPFGQAIQNIVQFIRPGQTTAAPQQAVNQPTPQKVPEQTAAVQTPEKSQSDPIPAAAVAEPAKEAQPAQAVTANQPEPVQPRPIQQLVQNNPIIKGIQNAVQRIQGNQNRAPNPETPRNENKDEEKKEELKGHGGVNNNNNNANQGDSDISGVEVAQEQVEEIKPINQKEIVEEIKAEETIIPSISDKTE